MPKNKLLHKDLLCFHRGGRKFWKSSFIYGWIYSSRGRKVERGEREL